MEGDEEGVEGRRGREWKGERGSGRGWRDEIGGERGSGRGWRDEVEGGGREWKGMKSEIVKGFDTDSRELGIRMANLRMNIGSWLMSDMFFTISGPFSRLFNTSNFNPSTASTPPSLSRPLSF